MLQVLIHVCTRGILLIILSLLVSCEHMRPKITCVGCSRPWSSYAVFGCKELALESKNLELEGNFHRLEWPGNYSLETHWNSEVPIRSVQTARDTFRGSDLWIARKRSGEPLSPARDTSSSLARGERLQARPPDAEDARTVAGRRAQVRPSSSPWTRLTPPSPCPIPWPRRRAP
jgi:hypothetical protein